MTGRYFFSVILLICVATAAAQYDCPYTLVTKTGIQEPNATDCATVALIFGYNSSNPITIPDLRANKTLCTHSFKSDTLDVFCFYGPCVEYCDMALKLDGHERDTWYLELFQLVALFPNTSCHSRMYHANTNLTFANDEYKFNFYDNATEAVGTEKQKLTGASLLRLVGMPSYTT